MTQIHRPASAVALPYSIVGLSPAHAKEHLVPDQFWPMRISTAYLPSPRSSTAYTEGPSAQPILGLTNALQTFLQREAIGWRHGSSLTALNEAVSVANLIPSSHSPWSNSAGEMASIGSWQA